MLGAEDVWTWVVAHIRALLPDDWAGTAGELFREGTQAISQFASENDLLPDTLAEKGIDLAGRKIKGLATQEDAAAQKNYAEAAKAFTEEEDRKIAIELNRRALESDVQKREADAQKAKAEARKASADADLTEIQVMDARFELIRKLEGAGMMLHKDDNGNLAIYLKTTDSAFLLASNPIGDSRR